VQKHVRPLLEYLTAWVNRAAHLCDDDSDVADLTPLLLDCEAAMRADLGVEFRGK
jgi:hypothetical protein